MKSKKTRCVVTEARLREKINAHKFSVGNPTGNRQSWRPWNRWEALDWLHLAQDKDQWQALVNTAMNIRIPGVSFMELAVCNMWIWPDGRQLLVLRGGWCLTSLKSPLFSSENRHCLPPTCQFDCVLSAPSKPRVLTKGWWGCRVGGGREAAVAWGAPARKEVNAGEEAPLFRTIDGI
jgi:hypothetical protein